MTVVVAFQPHIYWWPKTVFLFVTQAMHNMHIMTTKKATQAMNIVITKGQPAIKLYDHTANMLLMIKSARIKCNSTDRD